MYSLYHICFDFFELSSIIEKIYLYWEESNDDDVGEAMLSDDIVGLGEMMNFPGVLYGDDEVHRKIQSTLKNNKTVTGHYSMPEIGPGLNAYIDSGVSCCHESVRKEDALARIRLGVYAQLREGSAWHDVKETIRCVTENNLDTRFVTLVSDDRHANTLIEYGHMDHIVKRAIEEGVNPINAIQMTTINVADCFNVSRDLGSISPGKLADIAILDDLSRVKVDKVLINGELVSDSGKLIIDIPRKDYPDFAKSTMNLGKTLTPYDFEIVADLVEKLDEGWKELGCDLVSPFMTMALIALAVLPELRLTNKGLVDTVNFKIVDLFV